MPPLWPQISLPQLSFSHMIPSPYRIRGTSGETGTVVVSSRISALGSSRPLRRAR